MSLSPLQHPLALFAWHFFAAVFLALFAILLDQRRQSKRSGEPKPTFELVWTLLPFLLPVALVIGAVVGPLTHGLRGSAAELPVSSAAALAAGTALVLLRSRGWSNCYAVFLGPPLGFVTAWFAIATIAAALRSAL